MGEMIPSHLSEKCSGHYCLIWYFRYGTGFNGPRVLEGDNIGASSRAVSHQSTFLHPKFELRNELGATVLEHWLMESITFKFNTYGDHIQPFQEFICRVLAVVSGGTFSAQACTAALEN